MHRCRLALLLAALAGPVLAGEVETRDGPGGTLNPQELSLGRVLADIAEGKTTMTNCAAGYYLTKSGRHILARHVFRACAEAGWTAAMSWMAQLDDNGLGALENPEAAADWDRRAAEAGDPVGKLNLGIDLLRGRGVPLDPARGRQLIDAAAADGLQSAGRLKAAGYDLDVVTPDADNGKYAPAF